MIGSEELTEEAKVQLNGAHPSCGNSLIDTEGGVIEISCGIESVSVQPLELMLVRLTVNEPGVA